MRDALYILGQGFYFVPNALIIRVGYVMSALRIFFYTFVWQRSMGLMKTHALHVNEREQHIRRSISVWLICWNKNGNKRIMMRRLRSKQYWKGLYLLSYGKVKLVYCHNVEEYHRKKTSCKIYDINLFLSLQSSLVHISFESRELFFVKLRTIILSLV